jgi:hypothetical protein
VTLQGGVAMLRPDILRGLAGERLGACGALDVGVRKVATGTSNRRGFGPLPAQVEQRYTA